MRRVMAVIGFSSFFACIFCIFAGKTVALIAGFSALAAMIILAIFKKTRLAVLLLLFAAICVSSFNCFFTESKIEKYNNIYCDKTVTLEAKLLDYPYETESGFSYTFRTEDENKVKFSVLTSEPLGIEPLDKIKGTFNFTDDYADKSEKIYFSEYIYNTYEEADIEIIEKGGGFGLAQIRKSLKQGITDNTTFGRGLTTAILFGDKSGLQDELYNDLLRCGLLHATATSGLHLTVITGFLFAFLSFLGVSRKKSSVFAILFVLLFMMVIGFKFSLMRAGIMMILYFAAGLFNRENDGFNAIGTAFTVLILQNPYTVVSCSFLLSASATMGMVLLFQPLYAFIERLKFGGIGGAVRKFLLSLLASIIQSFSAILFTLPVTYIFFGYFSIAGLFANALLAPLISFILVCGVLLCLIFYIPVIPEIIGGALDMVCLAVIKISGLISDFKYCLISIDYGYLAWFFLGCSVVTAGSVAVFYFVKADKRKIIRTASLLCFDLLLLTVLAVNIFPRTDAELNIYNSNGKICAVLIADNEMMVIDSGGKNLYKKVNSQMTKKNIDNVSFLIVPKNDKNSFASASVLSKSLKVNNVLSDTSAYENMQYDIDGKKFNIAETKSVKFKNITVKIINQQNNCALYLTNGKVSVLILDSGIDCSLLPEQYKKCSLLAISDAPPSGLDEITAEKAVICTYEKQAEQITAQSFDTYSIKGEYLRVFLNDKLKIQKE